MMGLLFIFILGNVLPFASVSNQEPKNVTKQIETFQNEYIVVKEQENVSNRKTGRTIHQTAWSKEEKTDSQEISSSHTETETEPSLWSFKKLYDLVLHLVHKLNIFESKLLNSKENQTSTKINIKENEANSKFSQNKNESSTKFYEKTYLELLRNSTNEYSKKEDSDYDESDTSDSEIKLSSGSKEHKNNDLELQKQFTEPVSIHSLEKPINKGCKSSEDCNPASAIDVKEEKESKEYSEENAANRESKNTTANFTEENYSMPALPKNVSFGLMKGDEMQSNKKAHTFKSMNNTFPNLPQKEIFNFQNIKTLFQNSNISFVPRTNKSELKFVTNYPFHRKLHSNDKSTILPSNPSTNENINLEQTTSFRTVTSDNKSDLFIENINKNTSPLMEEPNSNSSEIYSLEDTENQTKFSKAPEETTTKFPTTKQIKISIPTTAIPNNSFSTKLSETLFQFAENNEHSSHGNSLSDKNENENLFLKLGDAYINSENINPNNSHNSELVKIDLNSKTGNISKFKLSKEETDKTKITLFDLFSRVKMQSNNNPAKTDEQSTSELIKQYFDFNKEYEGNNPVEDTPALLEKSLNDFKLNRFENTGQIFPINTMFFNQFYQNDSFINADNQSQLQTLEDINNFTEFKDADGLKDIENNRHLYIDTFSQLYPDQNQKPDSDMFTDNKEKPKETFDTILQFLYKHSNNRFIKSLKNLTTH